MAATTDKHTYYLSKMCVYSSVCVCWWPPVAQMLQPEQTSADASWHSFIPRSCTRSNYMPCVHSWFVALHERSVRFAFFSSFEYFFLMTCCCVFITFFSLTWAASSWAQKYYMWRAGLYTNVSYVCLYIKWSWSLKQSILLCVALKKITNTIFFPLHRSLMKIQTDRWQFLLLLLFF